MTTPVQGDRFIPMQTSDGKSAAFKLTKAASQGDQFIPVQTADGKTTAMKVIPVTTQGEQGFPVQTSDGRIVLVKEDAGITGTVWVGNFSTVGGNRCIGGCSFDGVDEYNLLYPADDPAEDGFYDSAFNNVRQPYGWIMYGGDLIVYGDFQSIGGEAVSRIAKWNTVTEIWEPLHADEPNSTVQWAEVIGSDLYIGGSFTTIGATTVNRVAKWNGTSWSALGATPGVNSSLYGMVQYGGNIVVGGFFTTAGGSSIPYLAQWNGSAWSSVGTGAPNSWIRVVSVANSKLYVSGNFTNIGGGSAGYVAEWNGSAWSYMDGGLNSYALFGGGVGDKAFFATSSAQMGVGLGTPLTAKRNIYWDGSWHNMSDTAGTSYIRFWWTWGDTADDILCSHSGTAVGGLTSQNLAIWSEEGFRRLPNNTQTPDVMYGYFYDSVNSLHLMGTKYLVGDYLVVDSAIAAVVFDGETFANITRPNPSEYTVHQAANWGFYWDGELYLGMSSMYDVVTTNYYSNHVWKVNGDQWELVESSPGVYYHYNISGPFGEWLKIDSDTGNLLIPFQVLPSDQSAFSSVGFHQFDGTSFSKVSLPDYRNSTGAKDPSKEITKTMSRFIFNNKMHYIAHNSNLAEFYNSVPAIIGAYVGYPESDEWNGYWNGSYPNNTPDIAATILGQLFLVGGASGHKIGYWDGTNYVLLENKSGITVPTDGGNNCLIGSRSVIVYDDTSALYAVEGSYGGTKGVYKIRQDTNEVERIISKESMNAYNAQRMLMEYDGRSLLFNRAHYIIPVVSDVDQDPIRGNGVYEWDNDTETWSVADGIVFGKTEGEAVNWNSTIQTSDNY